MLEVPLLSADECQAVVTAATEATSLPGYEPTFFHFDLSTEVPLQDLSQEVRCAEHARGTAFVKGIFDGVVVQNISLQRF